MKKILFSLLALIFIFFPSSAFAEDIPVRLVVDGSEVMGLSAPPIIVNERTLVPVREVFERVGGIVGWHSGHRQVTLFFGDNVLVMTIDETSAILNGQIIQMHTPPIIHNDRTMVPLRFPAEVFGFDVDWDNESRSAIVNSPGNGNGNRYETVPDFLQEDEPPPPPDNFERETDVNENVWEARPGSDELPPPGITVATDENASARDVSTSPIYSAAHPQTTITALRTPAETGTAAYIAVASSPISEVHHFLLPDNRLVVDIHNAVSMISGSSDAFENIPVSGVRASQFSQTPRVTRIVFDLIGAAEYNISLSSDRKYLAVSFAQNRISGIFTQSDAYSDTLFIQGDVLPAINISTEGFPHYITINIDNAVMNTVGGTFDSGIFATHFDTGIVPGGASFVRVYLRDAWPSFSIAHSENAVAFMMHHGVSGVRYDSVNRELRISRDFAMDINQIQQINDYHHLNYTFVLPPGADVLGRGEISVLDGFINSVALSQQSGNVHLTLNTTRVMSFSIHEEPDFYVIRAHLPREISPFIVVIDPGHGGADPGAMHNGIVEKDYALEISRMVMQLLEADPFITAYMTRHDDSTLFPLNRAEFANTVGADLFVSIHLNAAEVSPGVPNTVVSGIETLYTVGELEQAGNHSLSSLQFAQIIQRHIIGATGANDRGARDRPDLIVLRETNMPSVILELGFITNPDDAARLQDPQYQWQIVQAIYYGIAEAFATHPPSR